MNFHTELLHIDHRQLPNILIKEKKRLQPSRENKYSLITLKSLEGNRKFSDPFQERISFLITKNQYLPIKKTNKKKSEKNNGVSKSVEIPPIKPKDYF